MCSHACSVRIGQLKNRIGQLEKRIGQLQIRIDQNKFGSINSERHLRQSAPRPRCVL